MARENIGESILGYIVLGVIFFIIIYPWILGIIALIVIIAVLVNIYNSGSIPKWNVSYTHLQKGKKLLKKKSYNKALLEFNESIRDKNVINGDAYLFRGLTYIKLGEKEKGLRDLESALKLINNKNSSNYSKCKQLIKKLKDTKNKTLKQKPQTQKYSKKKIKLKICSKKDILTLDGFDEEKAELFIQLREQGKIWYDIDSFVAEFNIQPHQMIMIQDRITFPLKPQIKSGKRKIEI